MKPLLLASALAVGIHGLFLAAEPDWLKRKSGAKPVPRVVTVSLSYHEPQRPPPEPLSKTPEIQPVKKAQPPEKKRQERPVVNQPKKALKKVSRPKRLPKKTPVRSSPVKTSPESQKIEIAKRISEDKAHSYAESFSDPVSFDEVSEHLDSRPDSKRPLMEDRPEGKIQEASIPAPPALREIKPSYRDNPAPQYPRLARRRGYQGTVILDVLVDPEGRVDDLRLFKSSGYSSLDRTAIASVREWSFEPGRKGGEKVKMWVRVPISFRLKE
jgi:protein TonB